MRPRLTSILRHLALLAPIFATDHNAPASPLIPLILAAQSANGQWLVTVNHELAPVQNTVGGRTILSTTFYVLQREPFVNSSRDLLRAPGALWSERWLLTLPAADSAAPPRWPVVSDDGQTLILVTVSAPSPDTPVLAIYRETQRSGEVNHGELVRSYPLRDLWPAERIDTHLINFGNTPQWFAGGQFSFSADSRDLLYRTPWGNTLVIRLSDGLINPQPPAPR